ncbi:MAG: Succinate dehydrogenase cytochrome b556 subunit [SAR116 cluster bacterium]|nr:succinate dehydrogenase, cytochrome b556 subunit [Alphaproteobacteria bacterium]MEC8662122.1 succinate dehydrogenase, cytochrome b556 subunit [Pseudomonadota bacterium]CAI8189542.1 MAG: Succinate dehydrogenase cytochrome b556 subunit [SAR116 cluster bacterium]HCI19729.1 succinate dehydrogenase, cytochrome b556 subunit [Alphaproteobacteria bacterium]|tara:strand:- start:264 stop:641 length:378 start_codon:yes stop_codon:yes gene_type:complete
MARTRPLSPHLQVYRPQMTSVMSILHRAAGVVLTTGTLIMAAWLVSLALGKEAYDVVVMVIGHPLGQFVLFGYSVALIYHALNGVRHLGWDLGFGLTIPQVYKNGQIVLFLTVVLTMGLWSAVWM